MANQISPAPIPNPVQQPMLKIPCNAQWITERLETYVLYQNDRDSYAKHHVLKNKVPDILSRRRVSTVEPFDLEEFQVDWEEYKDKNEDTVLDKTLSFFMKEERTVKVENTGEEGDAYHTVVSLLKSGSVEISNRESQRTYGYPIPAHIALWMEIMRGIHYVFFIIEGESYIGSMLDAWNQACLGGATLVSAYRRVLATIGGPDIVGAYMRTFVFPATLDPSSMQTWVHWTEVPDPGVISNYHLTKLDSCAIDNEQTFGPLRKVLNNILVYGCGDWFKDQQALYDSIRVYAAETSGVGC
ncbi:MAG: hypothetical protein Q9182_004952 [Xanthomendoza sp. 2 TL-2023]